MVQKAEQNYNRDYQDAYGRTESQNKWIWGALAALALLALVVWFATSGGPSTSTAPSSATSTEQSTAPAAPAVEAPAAEQTQPAQGQSNTQQ